ncbi:MAG: hypothetical protein KDK64_04035 [Chlamydiia bacterium]|nr:hypothetical protein [Chlamydiia bacterium]
MLRKLVLLLFVPLTFYAQEVWTIPWFTGPLLAPSATCNELRQVSWQPYLFVTNNFGTFDTRWNRVNTPDLWAIQPLIDITYGIATFMDIETLPAFVIQTSQGSTSIRLSDTPFFLGIQALRQREGSWIPDLRIRIQQIFPLGQYDKLNPKKHGTDSSGQGSYQSGLTFDFQKTFQMAVNHYFRLRWAIESILWASTVHVSGINAYGGAPDTEGDVRPGKTYNFYLSGEYTITRNWGFAFDTLYTLVTPSHFSGKKGGAQIGTPTSHQISFAPAIEYNYNEFFGIIGGAWFTLAGKNASQFYSGVISAVITY